MSDHRAVRILPMEKRHVADVLKLVTLSPELVFAEWEDEQLISTTIDAYPDFCFVAELEGGELIGASFGAAFCGRGTIPHIIIHPDHQHRRLGSQIVQLTLDAMRRAGCTVSHVFVTTTNDLGRRFWNHRMSFLPRNDTVAYEIDLDGNGTIDLIVEELTTANLEEVRAFVGELKFDPNLVLSHRLGTALFCRNENGEIVALAYVGTFGVRGILSDLIWRADAEDTAKQLIEAVKVWVARQRVFRMHAIVGLGSAAANLLQNAGFNDISVEYVEQRLTQPEGSTRAA